MNEFKQSETERIKLLRLPQVLEIIPISRSSWWAGVKSGKYPQPVKIGPRMTCWRLRDILALTETETQDFVQ